MANDFQILVKALIQASDLQGQLTALQDELKPLKINLDLGGLKGGGIGGLTPQIQNAQKAMSGLNQETVNLGTKFTQVTNEVGETLKEINQVKTGLYSTETTTDSLIKATGEYVRTIATTRDGIAKLKAEYADYLKQKIQQYTMEDKSEESLRVQKENSIKEQERLQTVAYDSYIKKEQEYQAYLYKELQIRESIENKADRLLNQFDDSKNKEYQKYLQNLTKENERYGKVQDQANAKARENDSVLSALEIKVRALTDAQKEQINAEQRLEEIKLSKSITEKSTLMKELNRDVSAVTGNMNTFRNTIDFTIERFLQLGLILAVFRKIKESISEIINVVTELDTSLVELQKVSDLAGSQIEVFTKRAYDAGTELARTGKEVIDATTIFSRAGYELEDAFELSKTSLLLTNVADGIKTVEEASSTLISVLKAFKMEASDAIHIVDALNAVSNNFAIDTDNLAEILQRVSGTLQQTGTTMEEVIGLAVGGFTTLRNAEMVSSGLNMIAQRMKGMKEDGEEIEGLVPKIEEALQKYTNGAVSMWDKQSGELRSTFDVLSDLAEVYPRLTSSQKAYLNEVLAGNRQNKVLVAVMNSWEDVESAVVTATDSTGSALEENEKYLNSIEGKINAVQSAWEKLAQKTITDETIKSWYDFLKIIIDATSSIGGLQSVLGILVVLFSKKLSVAVDVFNNKALKPAIENIKKFFSTLKTEGIGSAIKSLNKFQLAIMGIGAAITIFSMVTNAIKSAREATVENNIAILDNADAITEQKNELDELIRSYKELASSTDFSKNTEKLNEAKTIQEKIVSLVGEQATNLDFVNGKLDDQISKLESISLEKAKQNQYDLEAAKIASDENIAIEMSNGAFGLGGKNEGLIAYKEYASSIIEEYKKITDNIYTESGFAGGKSLFYAVPENLEEAKTLLNFFTELRNAAIDAGDTENLYYNMLVSNIKELTPLINDATKAYNEFYEGSAFIKVAEESKSATVQTKQDLDAFISGLISAENATGDYALALEQAAKEKYYLISGIYDNAPSNDPIQTLIDKLALLGSNIDSIQSAYKSLSDAISEYDKSGKISLDTLQSILALDPKYLQYLIDETGKINLNKDALESLVQAKIKELEAEISVNENYTPEQREAILELIRLTSSALGEEINKLKEESEVVDDIQSTYAAFSTAIDEYAKSGKISLDTLQSLLNLNPEYIKYLVDENGQLKLNKEGLEQLAQARLDDIKAKLGVDFTPEQEQAYLVLINMTTAALGEEITKLEELKTSIDEIQSSYNLFSTAVEEYNKFGQISMDTLQSILEISPEYLQYLFDENGQIVLNKEALEAMTEAKLADLEVEILASEEYTSEEKEYYIELLHATTSALGEQKTAIELAKEAMDDAISSLDEAQSAYETLQDAVKEYNKTGVLSVDTFQALMNLSPEFLSMFFNQATAVGNAEAAINSQVEALKLAKVQELQTAAAADILAYSQGNIAGMSPLAQAAISKVAGAALTAGGDFLTAAVDAGTFYQTVIDTAKKLGADLAGSSGAGIDAIIRAYQNAANKISNIKVSFGGGKSSGGGGGGGASAAEQQAKAIESAYDDLLSYTMKMLKKEQQDRIDALEEELDLEEELYKTEKERIEDEIDGYKEIIDKKKESLKLDKEEKEYNDDIADANKEISDLQDRLIELAFDTSESAKAERLKLQEELSKKETDLAKKQYNRGVDLAENALDTEYELYKEQQEQKLTDLEIAFEATKTDYEDRIDILKEYLEQENTIRSEAIALIEGRTAEFYNRLYEWNAKYGEVTSAVLQNIINLAHQTVSAVSRSGGGGGGDGSSKKSTTTTSSNTTTGKIPISKVLDIYGDDGDAEVSLTWGNSSSSGKSGSSSKVGTHHSGLDAGFVGGLKGNEQFVKALKGEVFINPKQQNDYMNKILPETINSSKNNIRCENLLSISVAGNIDSNSVQKIQKTVENEFQKLNKVFSGMGTTRKANSFAT